MSPNNCLSGTLWNLLFLIINSWMGLKVFKNRFSKKGENESQKDDVRISMESDISDERGSPIERGNNNESMIMNESSHQVQNPIPRNTSMTTVSSSRFNSERKTPRNDEIIWSTDDRRHPSEGGNKKKKEKSNLETINSGSDDHSVDRNKDMRKENDDI